MLLIPFLYSTLLALIIALWEIQIEGRAGWAESLPTWRVKNKWTKFFWDDKEFTGYHLYLNLLVLAIAHVPFAAGLPWTLSKELLYLSLLCFATVSEDIFWFIFNPAYGLGKLNQQYATWHKHWLGPIPSMYVKYWSAAFILLFLSYYFT